MAEFRLVSAVVVVLAESNNPRLLSPDFLQRNRIVPEGWKPNNVIVTPPFSTVQYLDGVTITMEEAKVTFVIDARRIPTWAGVLSATAIRFLETLPHVLYGAVGLNFTYHSQEPSGKVAEEILMANMVCQGSWMTFFGGMTGVNIEFQYRNAQPRVSLRLAVIEEMDPKQGAVLRGHGISANYHQDFSPEQSNERAEYIRQLGMRHEELTALIRQFPLNAPNV